MPVISIITPAYNSSEFISDTINSVLNQTYSDWEMIIVDDCSKDNTYQISEMYAKKDNRIKVYKNKKNCGVATTRNIALSYATGEYIAFLDSDDLWKPEKLKIQIEFMKKNNYAFTYSKYQILNSQTGEPGKVISVPKKMSPKDIYKNTAIGCLTVMVNRKMTGEFEFPMLQHAEDQCTWQSILNRGFTAYGLDENLCLYRVGSNSLTANKAKVVKRQWKMYREYNKLPLLKSAYYLFCYAVNAVFKRI